MNQWPWLVISAIGLLVPGSHMADVICGLVLAANAYLLGRADGRAS
jgi:hypothetical protein